ncbi:hypothetical protein BGP77_09680 [Saccharospirillum sp. MSK14-1]|nr:hypothetical protein BGP77_09680 [Saccharospirillum sp. MSK14-1]
MRPDPPRPQPGGSVNSDNQTPLTLESVYILDQQAYAVINGQWLSVNERLGNYRVVSIEADRVVIQGNGERRTLTPAQSGSLQISMSHED